MPNRSLCANCGNAQRPPGACRQCGYSAMPLQLDHTGAGIAMYVAAALGGVMILLAFVGFAILVLVSLPVLGVALALNVVDDRALDARAVERARAMAASVARCPKCRTAMQVDVARGRGFCPRCGTYA